MMNGYTVVAPTTTHSHTVIFLHGRGSTAKQFKSEFFESEADGKTFPEIFPQVKWIFPNADDVRAARFKIKMPQWYDMWSTDNPHEREHEQQQGIESVVSSLLQMIDTESAIVGGPQNIVLAGISQGCAVAVHALLKQESKLGGFIGLSSWIPLKEMLTKPSENAIRTPVFLSHSENDDVIAIKYGEKLRDCLKESGMEVEWHAYEDGGHWINEPKGVGEHSNPIILLKYNSRN